MSSFITMRVKKRIHQFMATVVNMGRTVFTRRNHSGEPPAEWFIHGVRTTSFPMSLFHGQEWPLLVTSDRDRHHMHTCFVDHLSFDEVEHGATMCSFQFYDGDVFVKFESEDQRNRTTRHQTTACLYLPVPEGKPDPYDQKIASGTVPLLFPKNMLYPDVEAFGIRYDWITFIFFRDYSGPYHAQLWDWGDEKRIHRDMKRKH